MHGRTVVIVVAAAALTVATVARADGDNARDVPAGNLLQNPGGDAAAGSNGGAAVAVPGWTVEGQFTTVAYGTPAFLTTADSAKWGGGVNFFAGGPDGATNAASQTVDVSAAAAQIDAGGVAMSLGALLGGYASQDDNVTLTATALNAVGDSLASVALGPVTAADRQDETTLIARSASTGLPAGTRSIVVRMVATRLAGSYNDGYADNLSLTLSGPAASPTPTPTVTETPTATPLAATPTATPAPTPVPPAPVFHQSVVAAPVAGGTIRVRRPGGAGFETLVAGQAIPLGSTVDAKHGAVDITSVPKAGGAPEKARFTDGIFKVTQSASTTTLTLTEQLASCKKKASAAASRPKSRRLWGDGKGSFRTTGKYSSATIRGTKWLVQDSCSGTLTKVAQGVVTVRDDVKHKAVVVRAHHSYTAKPRR